MVRYDFYKGVKKIKNRKSLAFSGMASGFAGLLIAASIPFVAHAAGSFFNGFETDTSGWFSNGGTSSITRVPSGTGGVTSASGTFHANVAVDSSFNGVFTRWGGYESTFPANGYETQVDVYLNMADNPSTPTNKQFDFSSAINDPSGNHRRDFIFSVGTDPLVVNQFIMSASNNAPGWPSNPGRDPFTVNQSGWYTFRHTFHDDGDGVLQVDMDVLNSAGVVLHSWTLSDSSDVIGSTVGGHRYGWFVTSDFTNLAIDNSKLTTVNTPTNKDQCKHDGWKNYTDENGQPFKNQGACEKYFQNKAHGNVSYAAYGLQRKADFHVDGDKNKGEFKYSDANHDSYKVKVSSVKTNGHDAWFAGVVTKASDPSWVGQWLFAKVHSGSPDQIWGSFTTQAAAQSGVNAMANPSDGPFDVTKGNIKVNE